MSEPEAIEGLRAVRDDAYVSQGTINLVRCWPGGAEVEFHTPGRIRFLAELRGTDWSECDRVIGWNDPRLMQRIRLLSIRPSTIKP